jgi:hypothetical protein
MDREDMKVATGDFATVPQFGANGYSVIVPAGIKQTGGLGDINLFSYDAKPETTRFAPVFSDTLVTGNSEVDQVLSEFVTKSREAEARANAARDLETFVLDGGYRYEGSTSHYEDPRRKTFRQLAQIESPDEQAKFLAEHVNENVANLYRAYYNNRLNGGPDPHLERNHYGH